MACPVDHVDIVIRLEELALLLPRLVAGATVDEAILDGQAGRRPPKAVGAPPRPFRRFSRR